nr:reverse transcriptase domain-containing protein [Tanacetum cinerariifolium]
MNQMEKFFQIFQDFHFDISFADALLLMPKFTSTIKSLLTNKDTLFELAKIPLNENYSAMPLKKLLKKLGDPGKFLIPCDFLGMDMTLELANRSITRPKGVAEDVFVKVGKFYFSTDFVVVDFEADPRVPLILGRSFFRTAHALINVYREEITLRVNDEGITFNLNQTTRYSSTYDDLLVNRVDIIDVAREEYAQEILKKSFPIRTYTTQMTLELANRSITRPKGVAEDVFVKVGKFYFSTDFVVVDFEADPRVPLILGRSFFRTAHALINVYREEITLRVNDEGITFNLNQTTRYSSTYDDLLVNRVDIIDVAREEYAQEILSFSSNSSGGNPTSTFKPILSDSSPSLTSFEGSDFILEEIDAYLKDESVSPKIDHADCDPEGDICLIKKLLNNDPFQLPLMDLKQEEVVKEKSLIEEPLELELKKLPSHLEYAYLEGVDKTFQRSMMAIFHDMIEKTMEVFMDDFLVFGDSFSSCLSHLDTMLQRSGENHIHLPMYGTFAYCRMPFGLCNAPGTFQRCMMEIFHDMIEKTMEVFMDDFFVFENSFQSCLSHLERMLKRCEDTNLCLNWEKSHFMVKEGIVIGHKIFKQWIEVDKAKVYFITKLPHPKTVKGIRSFLGHVGFYRRFIKDFSKISRPMTRLFEKDTHSFSLKSVLRHSKHSKESLLKLLS